MPGQWKCVNCGGINPKGRTTCLGCNTPYTPPEEIERQKFEIVVQDVERLKASINAKARDSVGVAWEYCFILTGISTSNSSSSGNGIIIFVSDGETIDLGESDIGVALNELGKTGWELIEVFVSSDLQRQYPVKNLRPMWSYMLDAAFNQPPGDAIYAYESIREADGLFFILKRPR